MACSEQMSLLMPSCPKWSDKARMIKHYFQRMHDVDIAIVDSPPTSGILIALEKDNLATVSRQLKSNGCNLKALVLKDPNLYFDMDDKAQSSWRELGSQEIHFNEIPTLNMKSASELDAMEFIKECTSIQRLMLKPADEAASVGQAVVSTQDVPEILSYLGKAYVAQPFFSVHKILTIDFLAVNGEVKGHHCFYVDGPIENSHWKTGLYQQVLCNATPEIRQEFQLIQELTQQLSTKHSLNGIFEIEFLYAQGKTYFLELNLLPGLYGIDRNGLMPLMEKVLVPYLQHFQVDIQPRIDFEFTQQGQFYPPSNKSHEYYSEMYSEALEFASTREDSSEVTTAGSADEGACSACPSDEISLLMPGCPKWSDKARMIQLYFQRMHDIDIAIVDAPTCDGILIALEKENLASTARQVKRDDCNLKALVVNEPSLYFDMDDKSESNWRELSEQGISFNEIPTMNMKTASELDAMDFIRECASAENLMLKPSDEAASVGQAVISAQNVSEILSYLGKAYVAQPFFDAHKILTIDFLSVGGVIKGHHCFYVDGPIENKHWKTGLYQQVLCNATPEISKEFERILEVTKNLSKKHALNGIFEIEFLYAHGKAFFLELNLLPGLYGIDKNGVMPLMEKLIVPYLQHFQVDVQPRLDFDFEPKGQFYPPSHKSYEHYLDLFGNALDVTSSKEDSSELTTA